MLPWNDISTITQHSDCCFIVLELNTLIWQDSKDGLNKFMIIFFCLCALLQVVQKQVLYLNSFCEVHLYE